ncbi:RpiB/LacA/LacB family sugar-phosphate isomerase [bacterium]|nr:MAG: RpiB/LacA/LacB family sugar-phosphate isomerase [bacterium]
MIYIGADHRGYQLKERIKNFLNEIDLEYQDLGNYKYDKDDDYTDFGKLVAQKVSENPNKDQGILICGSGVGMDITANRFKGVRSVLAPTSELAVSSRKDDDTNVLSLGANFLSEKKAEEIIKVWLKTEFTGEEKRLRRLKKIDT